jgi:hypothetical protein
MNPRADIREKIMRLPYAERRVLLCEVARSIVFGGDAPRDGTRRPDPLDIAACLLADLEAIARPFLAARGSTASQVAEEA